MTLGISESYIKFSEPDTDKAQEARVFDTLRVDTASDQIRNIKGFVTLSPNSASFMDTWETWYPNFDTTEFDFFTVDQYGQQPSNKPDDVEAKPDAGPYPYVDTVPDFGFTFVFKRSPKTLIHSRSVYTFLEFLGDVGGLNDALTLILAPFVSFFTPSLFMRAILNRNFRYDDDGKRDSASASNT